MTDPNQIDIVGPIFKNGLLDILGDKLFGIYIFGAAAFPGSFPLGDIDVHVIIKSQLTADEKIRLEKFHEDLDTEYATHEELFDGYYILLDDARKTSPPRSQMWQLTVDSAWALHRAHILAGRQITFYGPSPETIYQPAEWSEIETALYNELEFVERHSRQYPGYCYLNLCRLIYSFENKDVVISKEQAFDWGKKNLSQWEKHIELAGKSYSQRATDEENKFLIDNIEKFLSYAKERIRQSK
jgi:hypothetical protein